LNVAKSTINEMYEGSRIKYKYLKDRDKHGISAHIQKEYYDSATNLRLRECRIDFSIPDYYDEVSMDQEFVLSEFSFTKLTRQVNHIVYLLDKLTLVDRIKKDDQTIQLLPPGFTLAQITEFIKVAQEAGTVNVLALLLEYKNSYFADFDPMDEFTLEW